MQEVSVSLMDTAGQEDLKHIRTLSYPGTHTFIVCFSVVDKVSFKHVHDGEATLDMGNWLLELRNGSPDAKILLVGTKKDLRGQKPASFRDQQNARASSARYSEVCKIIKFYFLKSNNFVTL